MKRVIIYIPGILCWPGDHRNWDGRAVTWTMIHSEARADAMNYFTFAFSRALFHRRRIRRLQTMIRFYKDFQIDLVGHSNGAHIIVDALRESRVNNIHLVCAACESDFNKNGLNDALKNNRVQSVKVYCGGNDEALALATIKPAQWFGYGHLGRCGPENLLFPGRVQVIRDWPWANYGHSTCWNDSQFDSTMRNFV